MRKAILPIAGILLLGAGIVIGRFASPRETPEAEQKAASNKPDDKALDIKKLDDSPALERVDEAEAALRLAGFEYAFVYRWRGSLLDGYILLDTPQGTERVAVNIVGMGQRAFANQQASERRAEQPVPQGKARIDPARSQGLIVIAIRPKVTGTAGHECIGGVQVMVEAEDERASEKVGSINLFSGRLPDITGGIGNAGSGGGHAFWKLNVVGGKERELFQLRLHGR